MLPPLFEASYEGDLEAVWSLLRARADVNAREPQQQQTALIAAAYMGHTEVVQALVDAGARLEAKDVRDGTALNHACLCGHIGAARALLAAGADAHTRNKDLQTPPHECGWQRARGCGLYADP